MTRPDSGVLQPLVVFLALLLAALALAAACGGGERSAAVGRTAFLSSRDGNLEINVINADGSGRTHLAGPLGAKPPLGGLAPFVGFAWSPGGSKIAFIRSRLYVVNSDGSGLTVLADSVFGRPAWSPDGQYIGFHNISGGDVYVIKPDGSGLSEIVDSREHGFSDVWGFAWSPDGMRILLGVDVDATTPHNRST